MSRWRFASVGGLCVLAALGGSGCLDTRNGLDLNRLLEPPTREFAPPIPSSPAGALRVLQWSYNHRAIEPCRELPTDDFRFVGNPTDSAGGEYRGTIWTREDFLIRTAQLFAAATSVRLTLDKNFFVYPDPTAMPWDPTGRWHKNIRTHTLLRVEAAGSVTEISGAASFYLVRGDAALIPEDLKLRGFGADSTRWYIRRWDDETVGSAPLLGAGHQRASTSRPLSTRPSTRSR